MTTLQEYLNNKYPTPEDKEAVIEIATSEITETLEGGELDLKAFKNLEQVIITNLTTPLTKIEVDGLIHLKELILPDKPKEETEEEKKLYEELGIVGDIRKREVVQELKRLGELWSTANAKQVNVYPSTSKSPREELKDKKGATESITSEEEGITGYNIYLRLGRKDKDGIFNPSLVFWTLSQELASISISGDKTPEFWKKLEAELNWVKENLSEEYQKDFENLLTPSTFPCQQLEINELLTVYYPNLETNFTQSIKAPIIPTIADQVWLTIKEKLLELLDQELKNSPDEEKLKELSLKTTVDYQSSEFTIQVNYQPNNPFRNQLEQLITNTPLQLEIEYLKKQQASSPTPENYEKLEKEKQKLEEYLQESVDTDTYRKIQEKMSKNNNK